MIPRQYPTALHDQDQTPTQRVLYWATPRTWPSEGFTVLCADYSHENGTPYNRFGNPLIYEGRQGMLWDYWGKGAPPGVGQFSGFVMKWTGQVHPPRVGTYVFRVKGMGRARIGLDHDGGSSALVTDVELSETTWASGAASFEHLRTSGNHIDCWYYKPQEGEGGYCFQGLSTGTLLENKTVILGAGFVQATTATLTSAAVPDVQAVACERTADGPAQLTVTVPLSRPGETNGWAYDRLNDRLEHRTTAGVGLRLRRHHLIGWERGWRSGGVDELYPGFRGHIADFLFPGDDTCQVVCQDSRLLLAQALSENYPDKASYWNAGYIRSDVAGEPDGAKKPVAYDAWPLEVALKDLCLHAGVDSRNFLGRAQFTNYTSGTSSGAPRWDDLSVVLPFQSRYGRSDLNIGDAKRLGEEVDAPYLFGSEITDTVADRVDALADYTGFAVAFDNEGYALLRARNNPTTIHHTSGMSGTSGWTSATSLNAIGGFYYDSSATNQNLLENASFSDGTIGLAPTNWSQAGGGGASIAKLPGGLREAGESGPIYSCLLTAPTNSDCVLRQTKTGLNLSVGQKVAAWIFVRALSASESQAVVGEAASITRYPGHAKDGIQWSVINRPVVDGTVRLYGPDGTEEAINSWAVYDLPGGNFAAWLEYDAVVERWGSAVGLCDYSWLMGTSGAVRIWELGGAAPHESSASQNAVYNYGWHAWEAEHTVVDGASTQLRFDCVVFYPRAGLPAAVALADLAGFQVPGLTTLGGSLQFDFRGTKLELVAGLRTSPGRARVRVTTGTSDSTTVVEGTLNTQAAAPAFYYETTPTVGITSPTVALVMDLSNGLGFGPYRCIIEPTSGAVRLNAAFVYDRDTRNPIWTLDTARDVLEPRVDSNAADQRNDAIVLGQRRLAIAAPGENAERADVINPSNPVVPYLFSRTVDVRSIFDPAVANFTGHRRTSIIADDSIPSQPVADWLSWSFIDRYRKPGPSVSFEAVGMPWLEVGDALALRDARHGLVDWGTVVQVAGLTEEMRGARYATRYDCTPYREFPSLQPKPPVDTRHYGGHRTVNVRIAYTAVDTSAYVNPTFPALWPATGPAPLWPMYDPYDSEGPTKRFVSVRFDVVQAGFHRLSLVGQADGSTVAWLTAPDAENHWLWLDQGTDYEWFWDGVDMVGDWNRRNAQVIWDDPVTPADGFYVHNHRDLKAPVTTAAHYFWQPRMGTTGNVPYGQFYARIESRVQGEADSAVSSNALDRTWNPTTAAFVFTHLGDPLTGTLSATSGLVRRSGTMIYRGLMPTSGIRLTIAADSSGRQYRPTVYAGVRAMHLVVERLHYAGAVRSWFPLDIDPLTVEAVVRGHGLYESRISLDEEFGTTDTVATIKPRQLGFTTDAGEDEILRWGDYGQAGVARPREVWVPRPSIINGTSESTEDMKELVLANRPLESQMQAVFSGFVFYFSGAIQDKSGRYTWCHEGGGPYRSANPAFPRRLVLARQWWDTAHIAAMQTAHSLAPYVGADRKTATSGIVISTTAFPNYAANATRFEVFAPETYPGEDSYTSGHALTYYRYRDDAIPTEPPDVFSVSYSWTTMGNHLHYTQLHLERLMLENTLIANSPYFLTDSGPNYGLYFYPERIFTSGFGEVEPGAVGRSTSAIFAFFLSSPGP